MYSNKTVINTLIEHSLLYNITVTTLLSLGTSLVLIPMLWVICERFVVYVNKEYNPFGNYKEYSNTKF